MKKIMFVFMLWGGALFCMERETQHFKGSSCMELLEKLEEDFDPNKLTTVCVKHFEDVLPNSSPPLPEQFERFKDYNIRKFHVVANPLTTMIIDEIARALACMPDLEELRITSCLSSVHLRERFMGKRQKIVNDIPDVPEFFLSPQDPGHFNRLAMHDFIKALKGLKNLSVLYLNHDFFGYPDENVVIDLIAALGSLREKLTYINLEDNILGNLGENTQVFKNMLIENLRLRGCVVKMDFLI